MPNKNEGSWGVVHSLLNSAPSSGCRPQNKKPFCTNPKARYSGKGHCLMDDMPQCPSGVYHDGTCLTGQTPTCSDPNTYHHQGRCISKSTPGCPGTSTLTPEGDCITHEKPKCTKGVLRKGECLVGEPWCPDGTDHRDDKCVSRTIPKCTEPGYE